MIPYGKHHIDDDDIQTVVDILRSGFLTQGPAVEAFENLVAEYVGVKYAIAVSSGTAALHLAALAAGVLLLLPLQQRVLLRQGAQAR